MVWVPLDLLSASGVSMTKGLPYSFRIMKISPVFFKIRPGPIWSHWAIYLRPIGYRGPIIYTFLKISISNELKNKSPVNPTETFLQNRQVANCALFVVSTTACAIPLSNTKMSQQQLCYPFVSRILYFDNATYMAISYNHRSLPKQHGDYLDLDLDGSGRVLWDIRPTGWAQLRVGPGQLALEWCFRAFSRWDGRLRHSVPVLNSLYTKEFPKLVSRCSCDLQSTLVCIFATGWSGVIYKVNRGHRHCHFMMEDFVEEG